MSSPMHPMPTMMFASPVPTVTSAAPHTSTAGSEAKMPAVITSDPAIIVDTAAAKNLLLVNRPGCQYDAKASAVSVMPPTTALASRVHKYTGSNRGKAL